MSSLFGGFKDNFYQFRDHLYIFDDFPDFPDPNFGFTKIEIGKISIFSPSHLIDKNPST